VGRPPGPKPVAGGQEVGLEDRLKHDLGCRHHHPIGHTRDTERPQLTWPPRLWDMNPPQRPRTVLARPELLSEFVEEVTHPGGHDVVDGHAIDAGRPAVSTDLAPSPLHDVAAGDLVKEGVETTILVLLSAAVQHALESTNPVHALGAADGSSRYGTHQSPSAPSRASMKRGPFPTWPAFPTSDCRVGGGGGYEPLPPPALPNRSCSFPASGSHRISPFWR